MKPIRVTHLSLAFVGLMILAIVALGGLMMAQLRQLTANIEARERDSAAMEVQEGINSLEKNLKDMALALARWDETKQQLVFPDYYSLWRDLRVRDAGMVSSSVLGVALYDKKGHILGEPRGEAMPEALVPPISALTFSRAGDDTRLYISFPIYADPDGAILLGYGVMKTDLLADLRSTRSYRYADILSLKPLLTTVPSATLRQLFERIDYSVLRNRELASIKDVIQVTFLRLLAVLLGLLVLGAWFFKHVLVGPLHRISQDIDMLRNAPGDSRNLVHLESPLRVLELDNVRRSFSDYHEKLALLRQDLEQSSRDFFEIGRAHV
jgi:hypothetical protein